MQNLFPGFIYPNLSYSIPHCGRIGHTVISNMLMYAAMNCILLSIQLYGKNNLSSVLFSRVNKHDSQVSTKGLPPPHRLPTPLYRRNTYCSSDLAKGSAVVQELDSILAQEPQGKLCKLDCNRKPCNSRPTLKRQKETTRMSH